MTEKDTNTGRDLEKSGGGEVVATNPAIGPTGVIAMATLDDVLTVSKLLIRSGLVPESFKSNVATVANGVMGCMALNINPTLGIQSMYVVKGRLSLFGSLPQALVERSGLMTKYKQEEIGTKDKDDWGFSVTVQRKGRDELVSTFTVSDAKKAGKWGKDVWASWPARMLLSKARGFALSDMFPDVLGGMGVADIAEDGDTVIVEVEEYDSQGDAVTAALKAQATEVDALTDPAVDPETGEVVESTGLDLEDRE